VAVLGDQQGVLELGRASPVLGHRRPPVRPDGVVDRAQGQHGLDGERHPRFHDHVVVRIVVVRHDQPRVERPADAVPGEVPHHPVPEPAGVRLDHPADGVQRAARRDRPDTAHHRLVGSLDQQPRFLVHVAGQEGGVGVAVHAADESGDVNVDDVAVVDQRVVGYPVADDLVQRGAQRLRVAAVAQRAGVGAVADQVVVAHLVQVVGRDARGHSGADRRQRLRGQLARHPHPLDDLGRLDVRLPGPGVLAAHVLRPRDVPGDLAGG
jgi:hypothetical protein